MSQRGQVAIAAIGGLTAVLLGTVVLLHLSRIWHEELAAHGVAVVAVDPGDMDTPLHAAAVPDADPASLKRPADAARELVARIDAERAGLAVRIDAPGADDFAAPVAASPAGAERSRR